MGVQASQLDCKFPSLAPSLPGPGRLQASHWADLGWVPLSSLPIPTPNPQPLHQAGEAAALTWQKRLLSGDLTGTEMQLGRGQWGPRGLARRKGVWSPPSWL